MKIVNYYNLKRGDVRIVKRGHRVFLQEFVHGGWEYFQLSPKQTLTSCIDEFIRSGFKYGGRETNDTVYYYHG